MYSFLDLMVGWGLYTLRSPRSGGFWGIGIRLRSEGRQGTDSDDIPGDEQDGGNPESGADQAGFTITGECGGFLGLGCDPAGGVGGSGGGDQEENGHGRCIQHNMYPFCTEKSRRVLAALGFPEFEIRLGYM